MQLPLNELWRFKTLANDAKSLATELLPPSVSLGDNITLPKNTVLNLANAIQKLLAVVNPNWKPWDHVFWITPAGVLQGVVTTVTESGLLGVKKKGLNGLRTLVEPHRAYRSLEVATEVWREKYTTG